MKAPSHAGPWPSAAHLPLLESLRQAAPWRRLAALHRRLKRCRLYRRYAWAILPLLVIAAQQINAHVYYEMSYGYDMPQHVNNMYALLNTGAMPPPPLTPTTYQAGQPPPFYALSGAFFRLGQAVAPPGVNIFQEYIPLLLMAFSLTWALLTAFFVQRSMARAPAILKALTLGVAMLFPVVITTGTMFNNDLPVMVLLTGGTITLWLMLRRGRQPDRALWLRAAAITGVAIAIKNNAVILIATYAGLAVCLLLGYAVRRRVRLAVRVAVAAALGLPLIALPLALTSLHALRYVDNLVNATVPPQPMWGRVPITFFTTFDTTIFERPFAYGPGEGSYWSLQYVTLHQDYYNHWNSPLDFDLPEEAAINPGHRWNIPRERYQQAIQLVYLGIPISLVILLGFAASLVRVVRRPRDGRRDGSLVIVLAALAAHAAQIGRFSVYADVQAVVIHARFISFSYIILLVIGTAWYWKLWGRRKTRLAALTNGLLGLAMLAYMVIALQRMWLPPG